jgi:hypothetical protein
MKNVWTMTTREARDELKTCRDKQRRNELNHMLFIVGHDDGGFH